MIATASLACTKCSENVSAIVMSTKIPSSKFRSTPQQSFSNLSKIMDSIAGLCLATFMHSIMKSLAHSLKLRESALISLTTGQYYCPSSSSSSTFIEREDSAILHFKGNSLSTLRLHIKSQRI